MAACDAEVCAEAGLAANAAVAAPPRKLRREGVRVRIMADT